MKPEAVAYLRSILEVAALSKLPEVKALARLAALALQAEGHEAPSPEAPPSRALTNAERQARFRNKPRDVTGQPVTESNGAEVTVGGKGGLSLIPENYDQKERERAQEVTAVTGPSNDAEVTVAVTRRRKHKYPETLAPDPEGPIGEYATWCIQWGFETHDASVRAMARWHYGKGTVWRDWGACLRTWKSKERPSGAYPTRAPAVQPVPAAGRAWKVGQ